jgi:hypothetical protein
LGLEVLHHLLEPIDQLLATDVSRLPALLKKPCPHRLDQRGWVVAPSGMAHHVGHRFFEVLHMGARLKARYVAAHEDTAQLGPWGGGLPFRIPRDVKRVVLFTIEQGCPDSIFLDAAAHPQVHQIIWVRGCLGVRHAVGFLRGWCGATYKEIIDVSADCPLLFGCEDVLLLHRITRQVRHLWRMRDAHGHTHHLAPDLATIDRVRGGEGELQHVLDVLERPTFAKHPTTFRHVGEGLAGWAFGGFIQLGFFVRLHDVLQNRLLFEGRVHRGEVVRCHALLGDLHGVGAHHPAELVDRVDWPIALQPDVPLPLLIGGLQAVSHVVQDLHQRFAQKVRWCPWWALLGLVFVVGFGKRRRSRAGNVPELVLLRLPDAVVVRNALAGLEAKLVQLGFQLCCDGCPRGGHILEDLVVTEVQGHLLLVPALANEEQPMGSSVIVQKDQMLSGLPDGLLEAREAIHLPNGLLRLRNVPVLHGFASDSGRPILQLLYTASIGILLGGPLYVVEKGLVQLLQDGVEGGGESELLASLGEGGQISPFEIGRVKGAHMAGWAKVLGVDVLEAYSALAIAEVIDEG